MKGGQVFTDSGGDKLKGFLSRLRVQSRSAFPRHCADPGEISRDVVFAGAPAIRWKPQVCEGLGRSPSRANRVEAEWGKFAVDSPLEEDAFELTVPPRRERLWAATPGKHCRFGPEPVSGSAFRAAVSDWQRPLAVFPQGWICGGRAHSIKS
jgi:hypothetical protein